MIRLKATLGAGGTGKSYYINQLIKDDPNYGVRTATTGIAAVNMASVPGAQTPTTINSLLGFFNAESLLRNYHQGKVFNQLKLIAKTYKNIIIDEISMMDAGTLDVIVLAVQDFNKKFDKDLGIHIVGDGGQLPPVKGKAFFLAKSWPYFKIDYLTEVKRQTDTGFINALNLVRVGKVKEAAPWFESNINFVDEVDECFNGTTFFSTNSDVDIFNRRCLSRLVGESKFYKAKFEGTKQDPQWKQYPQMIEVKRGAIILLLYNDLSQGFANGDSAIVEDMWDNSIFISLLRRPKSLHLRQRKLEYFTFNRKGYRKAKPDGTLKLLHARLAYALTIHKAQGLTLDSVQISLKGSSSNFLSRQSGMLYTALSRVRDSSGLTIVGSVNDLIRCCYVDPSYLNWIK